jgi:hypothetical protein
MFSRLILLGSETTFSSYFVVCLNMDLKKRDKATGLKAYEGLN